MSFGEKRGQEFLPAAGGGSKVIKTRWDGPELLSRVYSSDDDLKVIKTFSPAEGADLDQKWFDDYAQLSKYLDVAVNIISYKPYEEMVMEKYHGITMRDWLNIQHGLSQEESDLDHWGKSILKCVKIVNEINSVFINYSALKGMFVKHDDLTVDNILMKNTEDYRLIDLNSINFKHQSIREPRANVYLNELYFDYARQQSLAGLLKDFPVLYQKLTNTKTF